MFKVVGWNIQLATTCELCGNQSNNIDMVIDLDRDETVYFPACRDCTNGRIISDSIINTWNKLSTKLKRRCYHENHQIYQTLS